MEDPTWGPAPQPPKRAKLPLVIAALVGVVGVAAVVIVLVVMNTNPASSPEDRIRANVAASDAAWNRGDAAAFAAQFCKAYRATVQTSDEIRKNLDVSGPVQTGVDNIVVSGEHASATLTFVVSKSTPHNNIHRESFAKEDGEWKDCGPAEGNESLMPHG